MSINHNQSTYTTTAECKHNALHIYSYSKASCSILFATIDSTHPDISR